MQTSLADFIRYTPDGNEAEKILRNCVHCGFCTATCPTYQLLGDELDGPRGRIYQIKQVLEGDAATPTVRQHLDRCLTCRSCETTCPSGVDYHRLLDIGRKVVEEKAPRPFTERLMRKILIQTLAYPKRLKPFVTLGQFLKPAMPASLKEKIPNSNAGKYLAPSTSGERRMLIMQGCAQSAMAPEINDAAVKIFAHLDIRVDIVEQAGCCGALPHHLNDHERSLVMAKKNIDAWIPELDAGCEAIIITASGCGAHLKDYGKLLADDPNYAEKAQRVADLCRDPAELLLKEDIKRLKGNISNDKLAVHTPCTLQHALGLNGSVETLLGKIGYELCGVEEGHLCCGSAGTYSITQPKISNELRTKKLYALNRHHPDKIVTANIGCMMHLQEEGGKPVGHWLNLVADDLGN